MSRGPSDRMFITGFTFILRAVCYWSVRLPMQVVPDCLVDAYYQVHVVLFLIQLLLGISAFRLFSRWATCSFRTLNFVPYYSEGGKMNPSTDAVTRFRALILFVLFWLFNCAAKYQALLVSTRASQVEILRRSPVSDRPQTRQPARRAPVSLPGLASNSLLLERVANPLHLTELGLHVRIEGSWVAVRLIGRAVRGNRRILRQGPSRAVSGAAWRISPVIGGLK